MSEENGGWLQSFRELVSAIAGSERVLLFAILLVASIFLFLVGATGLALIVKPSASIDTSGRVMSFVFSFLVYVLAVRHLGRKDDHLEENDQLSDIFIQSVSEYISVAISKSLLQSILDIYRTQKVVEAIDVYKQLYSKKLLKKDEYDELTNYLLDSDRF